MRPRNRFWPPTFRFRRSRARLAGNTVAGGGGSRRVPLAAYLPATGGRRRRPPRATRRARPPTPPQIAYLAFLAARRCDRPFRGNRRKWRPVIARIVLRRPASVSRARWTTPSSPDPLRRSPIALCLARARAAAATIGYP